jgi:hypothetical protein
MQEQHLFEYAVIRVVPRVEREEFVNVGVILFCQSQRFLESVYNLDEVKLKAFSPQMDIEDLSVYLKAFENICCGGKSGGVIGAFPLAPRFRWLTATRSSVVQTSKVHPGFCIDPKATLLRLYEQLVL